MHKNIDFFRVTALSLGLLLGFTLVIATPPAIADKSEAKTLLGQQRGDEAYAAYMLLLRKAPEDDEIILGLARAALLANRPSQAIFAYETLTRRYPDHAGLRRELARAYESLKFFEAAHHEYRTAERLDAVMPNVGKDLPTTHDTKGLIAVRARLNAGVVHDSNISLGPAHRDIEIDGLHFHLNSDDIAESAWGGYVKASLDARRRFTSDSPWALVADAAAYQKSYIGESNGIVWGRAAVGLARAGRVWGLDLRLKGEQVQRDLRPLLATGGMEGSLSYAISPRVQLLTKTEFAGRDYEANHERSGTHFWLGEYLRLRFRDGACEMLIGGRWISNNAAEPYYDSTGWEISGQFLHELPLNSEVRLTASLGREDYAGPARTEFIADREDKKLRLGLVLIHHLTKNLDLDFSAQHVRNTSNTKLFDYDQYILGAGLTWSF